MLLRHTTCTKMINMVAAGFFPAAYAAPAHNMHQDDQQTLHKSTRTGKILIDPALDAKYRAMKPPCTRCLNDKYTRFRYFNNKNALLSKGKEPQARFACKSPKCLAAFPEKSEVEFTYDGKVRPPYVSKNKKRTAAETLTSAVSGDAASTSASPDSIKRPRKAASSSQPSKQHVDSYAPNAYARNVHLCNSRANICIPAVQHMMLAVNNVAPGIPAPPHMVMANNVNVALGVPAPQHMTATMPAYPANDAERPEPESSPLPPLEDIPDTAGFDALLAPLQDDVLGMDAVDFGLSLDSCIDSLLPTLADEQNFHANEASAARADDEFTLAELLGGTYTDHDQEEAAAIAREDPRAPSDRYQKLMEEMTLLLQDDQYQQLPPATITSSSSASPPAGTSGAADDVHVDELEGDDLMRWLMPI